MVAPFPGVVGRDVGSVHSRRIREIVVEHEAMFLERWNEHFSA